MDIKPVFADLHIHSKYSRATSSALSLENLEKWARIKGLGLLGTGDFTHPKWLQELKENLTEKNGLLYSKNSFKFVLSGEISLIYTQGRGRSVHLLLIVPSFEIVDKINDYLDKRGFRRDYDGRPVFGMSCPDFIKAMKNISDEIEIIPTHIWTPYFGVFGSSSGFDSLKEAFLDEEKNIHAIETGMSSSPEMNWKIKELNNKAIVSFSDSHSFWPWRLGREATIFSKIDSYKDIIKEVRDDKILGTIETDPAYGKYHWDGHRNCKFSCSPKESVKLNNICPVCHNPLTIGVENRVERIADQEIKERKDRKPFYKLLPLHEIISLVYNTGMSTKKAWVIYNNLIEKFGNEFNVLLNVKREDMVNEKFDILLIEQIILNRQGKIKVIPGFDGEYGKAVLNESQKKLF